MVARLLLALIAGYRAALSPLLAPRCRYLPTCSAYAGQAISDFGAARGGWLALRRLLRCHPFHPGGYDPVPVRRNSDQDFRPRRPHRHDVTSAGLSPSHCHPSAPSEETRFPC